MAYVKVATLDELEVGATRLAELAEPVCLVRTDPGTVKAVHDTCSHQQYSLCEGWVDLDSASGSGAIECALHGSTFDLDTGRPDSLPAVRPIPVYACKVDDGAIWVDLDQQLNDALVPRH